MKARKQGKAQAIHRPSSFKAPKKRHNPGRHRSKGELARYNRGRLDRKPVGISKTKATLSKAQRKNSSLNRRTHKRLLSTGTIVSLDSECTSSHVVTKLLESDPENQISHNSSQTTAYIVAPRFKFRCGLVAAPSDNLQSVLNSLKASDLLLVVWPREGQTSDEQELLLSTLMAFGIPTAVHVVSGLPVGGKQRERIRKELKASMGSWGMMTGKLFNLDTASDALNLLRHLASVRKKPTIMQNRRPYLLVDEVEQCRGTPEMAVGFCTLKVSGYARGPSFDVNKPVHLHGWGDFLMKEIVLEVDPRPLAAKGIRPAERRTLAVADSAKQTKLDFEVTLDPADEDQPSIDDEAIQDANSSSATKVPKKVPKGTSDYQAAWIEEDEQEDGSVEGDDDEQCDVGMEQEEENGSATGEDEPQDSAMSVGEGEEGVEADEVARYREERENQRWPDEVEVPHDMSARERFQKYRGLKSFRTTSWDPKENLPRDYARIYKFSNFKHTKKVVLSFITAPTGAESDSRVEGYITLHIANVPIQLYDEWKLGGAIPKVIYGLLPHEHRMSTMTMVLRRHPSYTAPIKNKERLIFEVGYRRFEADPVLSQHSNGDKFKMERFLPNEGTFCATVFAPIQFPPANVLVFKRRRDGQERLVAVGSVLDLNPDRIILKRAILSGHPFKVNKRSAVVKYMFFRNEDIEWFKPVELFTQNGRRGHIKESIGTHGLIKCQFDRQLTVQDPVMMSLYKRVFPKWTYNGRVPIPMLVQPCTEMSDPKMEE